MLEVIVKLLFLSEDELLFGALEEIFCFFAEGTGSADGTGLEVFGPFDAHEVVIVGREGLGGLEIPLAAGGHGVEI